MMTPEEKIKQFKRDFPEVVSSNLADVCLWLDNDIGMTQDVILGIMKDVNDYIYLKVMDYLLK